MDPLNVTLVDANDASRISIYTSGQMLVEPLGLEYIGASLQKAGHRVTILQKHTIPDLGRFAAEILESQPSVVGFSVLAYNQDIACDLARTLKTQRPSTFTVFGGYHPSLVPSIVEDDCIDYVIVGEGEQPFVELLQRLESRPDLGSIKGLVCHDEETDTKPERACVSDLDSLPWPIRTDTYKANGFLFPSPSAQRAFMQVVYARGCSNNCVYCNSEAVYGNRVSWREPGRVVDEMESLQKGFGTNLLYFTDPTFNANRTRVTELCREIKDRQVEINWFSGCRPEGMDRELINTMKDAGCCKLMFGIESLDNSTLQRLGRSAYVAELEKIMWECHALGVITRGYIMIGYPWQDADNLNELEVKLRNFPIDDLRISFFTPFPGTPLFVEYERAGLIATEDLTRYTTDEPVLRSNGLSREQLLDARRQIFRSFYESREYAERIQQMIGLYPHLRQSFAEFQELLCSRGVV